MRNKYSVTVRNKLHTFQETDENENFLIIHMEATEGYIPTKPRAKCRVPLESLVFKKNATNTDEKKLNKVQRELSHTKKIN